MARGLTLDAGVLIAIDRGDRRAWAMNRVRVERGTPWAIPASALAQAWRGPRNARLARFLHTCEVVPLDEPTAKRAGELCGAAGTSDVVDASIVVVARARGDDILTADPDDLRPLTAAVGGVRVIDLRAL